MGIKDIKICTLSGTLLLLQVKFEDKEEVLDIPPDTKISELKKLLRNFTGLSPANFTLFINRRALGHLLDTRIAKPMDKQMWQMNLADEDQFEAVRK